MAEWDYDDKWPAHVPRDSDYEGLDELGVGSAIQCYHRSALYLAKIIDIAILVTPTHQHGQRRYLVHYHGWKARYDEWVPRSFLLHPEVPPSAQQRVIDYLAEQSTDEAFMGDRKFARLPDNTTLRPQSAEAKARKRLSLTDIISTDEATTQTIVQPVPRRGRTPKNKPMQQPVVVQSEGQSPTVMLRAPRTDTPLDNVDGAPTVAGGTMAILSHGESLPIGIEVIKARGLKITDVLWKQLQQDDELCRNAHLHNLPPLELPDSDSMQPILKDFSDYNSHRVSRASRQDLVDGFITLFDAHVGLRLLYPSERSVHESYFRTHPNIQPHQVYGPRHLLRLFVIFPELVAANPSLIGSAVPSERRLFTLALNEFLGCLESYFRQKKPTSAPPAQRRNTRQSTNSNILIVKPTMKSSKIAALKQTYMARQRASRLAATVRATTSGPRTIAHVSTPSETNYSTDISGSVMVTSSSPIKDDCVDVETLTTDDDELIDPGSSENTLRPELTGSPKETSNRVIRGHNATDSSQHLSDDNDDSNQLIYVEQGSPKRQRLH